MVETMTLEQALKPIYSVKGFTTVVEALMGGDINSIQQQSAKDISLIDAKNKLEQVRSAQENCQSDAAYWGYQGDVSYWSAVVNILEAAEITKGDLPYVAPPKLGSVVMDDCSKIEKYGREFLRLAKG